MKTYMIRVLIAIVAFALCGGPQTAYAIAQSQDAQQSQPSSQSQPSASPQRQVIGPDGTLQPPADQQKRGTSVDPSAAPLAPQQDALPNAPSASQGTTQVEQPQSSTAQPHTEMTQRPSVSSQPPSPEPLGTAAAEGIKTAGSGASKPAGTAIAPAKQGQTRSLLIKLGFIAAAGVAIGTVYGLSKASSSVPPNSGR